MATRSKPVTAYRLTKGRRDPLDITGSFIHGGRWNSVGTAVLYLGSSQALCILESRVHTPRLSHAQWTMCTIEVPASGIATLNELTLSLPTGWDNKPRLAASTLLGDQWAKSNATLGLYVPSVVSPGDMNIILNPRHRDFQHVHLVNRVAFHFDQRLFAPRKK